MLRSTNSQLVKRAHSNDSRDAAAPIEEPQYTLMEQVFLIALKDGKVSFWNDNISSTLRGCIIIELCLRDRIELEPPTNRRRSLITRQIRLKDATLTGDRMLDETIKNIKSAPQNSSVPLWLEYLNGENWNPWCWNYQLKFVKDRLAKDLAEKGVLSIHKTNFLLFDNTTYPLNDSAVKVEIIRELQSNLLHKWRGNASKLEPRGLSLILMSFAADLMEDSLADLRAADYSVAKTRLNNILDSNFEKEAKRCPKYEIIWAVYTTFLK